MQITQKDLAKITNHDYTANVFMPSPAAFASQLNLDAKVDFNNP